MARTLPYYTQVNNRALSHSFTISRRGHADRTFRCPSTSSTRKYEIRNGTGVGVGRAAVLDHGAAFFLWAVEIAGILPASLGDIMKAPAENCRARRLSGPSP